jgi:hypothetical protein
MGALVDQITYSSEVSLTLIVDDITRQRRDAPFYPKASPLDLVSWLNALQRQSAPLVHSTASREHLEAWLEEVDQHLTSDTAIAGLLAP